VSTFRGELQPVLIKLLVAKNVLTAQEIASMIAALEPEESK
jgi:hypothetical protein